MFRRERVPCHELEDFMNIDIDDYNKIRSRDRLHTARELMLNIPSAFQTARRIELAKAIGELLAELDRDLDDRLIDKAWQSRRLSVY